MEASELSELTPMIFNTGLSHLGSEASKYNNRLLNNQIVFFTKTYQAIGNLRLTLKLV